MKIKLNKIKPDPKQPRKTFDVDELVASIKEKGMIAPIVVDSDYQIIDGERRYRAAKQLGLNDVEVVVYDSKNLESDDRTVTQLMADVHHHRLPVNERDQAAKRLWMAMGQPKKSVLAKILGLNVRTITDIFDRITFIPRLEKSGPIQNTPSHITGTQTMKNDPELRERVVRKAVADGINRTEDIQRLTKRVANATPEQREELLTPHITPAEFQRIADKIVANVDYIIKNANQQTMNNLPPQMQFIVISALDSLKKHLNTWQAQEAETV